MKHIVLLLAGLAALFALPALAHDTVTYYYTNTLHSAVVETNAQGQVIERTYYAPYGQVLNRSMRDGPGYTGHEEDPATGLVYMQQRYYDPQSGRFLSTDPVLASGNGGSFNRYAYADGNPYTEIDPFGEVPTQPIAAPGPCNAGSGCARGGDKVVPEAANKQEVAKAKEGMPKSKITTLATITVTAVRSVAVELPEVALPAAGGLLTYTAYPITLVAVPSNLAPSDCGDGRCAMMSNARDRPPPNSKPIDQTPWSGDHGKIKGALGLGGEGVVVIDPSGNVWVQHPDGSWSNEGPAGNFTGSGKPSGRRGKDRNGH